MLNNIGTKLYLKWIEYKGFKHGENFNLEKGANIDAAFCSLISCGDNVTLAKDVYIIAHDASMKKALGKTKVSRVVIGNNVFVGAKTVIMPEVTIGDNVVIGSNSTVTKSIPSGGVWDGCPAHFLMSHQDFLKKHMENMRSAETSNESCSSLLKNEKTAYVD